MASVYIPSCNAVFLHVPKTAGYSVSTALAEAFAEAQSYPVRGMEKSEGAAYYTGRCLGHDVFARTWSFCFLRNPWDWTVSGWLHVTRNKRAYGDGPPDFERFLKDGWDKGLVRNPNKLKFKSPEMFVDYHTQITQSGHLTGPNGDDPVPNRVLRAVRAVGRRLGADLRAARTRHRAAAQEPFHPNALHRVLHRRVARHRRRAKRRSDRKVRVQIR